MAYSGRRCIALASTGKAWHVAHDNESAAGDLPTLSADLTAHLAGVVRAKRRFFAARALVVAGLCCLLLAAAIITADVGFAFGPLARWLAFGFVLSALGLILAGWLVRPCQRYREHEAVHDLEAACTEAGQLLRTSAEVARDTTVKGFSPTLSQALLRQAEDLLVKAPMARVVPWDTVRRRGWLLAAAAVAFALTVALWPDFRRGAIRLVLPAAPVTFTRLDVSINPERFERGQTVRLSARLSGRPVDRVAMDVRAPGDTWVPTSLRAAPDGTWCAEFAGQTRSFEVRLRAGDARVRRHVRFIDPPAVQSATAQVEYPAYMRLPAAALPLKDLRVPEGAILRFTFTLNHPLVRAAVRPPDGTTTALDHSRPVLSWQWTAVPGVHAFALAGEDAEGLSLKPCSWEVRGVPDRRPQVTLLVPDEDIALTPIGETPVTARVQDDFGIAHAEIILTVNGSERCLNSRETADAPRQLRFTQDLRLEDLKLEPGAAVRLHARARDFHPERTGWSVSEVRLITIRPLKILRQPTEPPPPSEGKEPDQLKQDLAALEQAIDRQKAALQETLQRREEQPASREPMPQTAATEQELATVMDELARRADTAAPPAPPETSARPPPRDQTPQATSAAPLLQQAEQRLQAAAESLTKPEMTEALRREDQALSAMMQARDLMQQQLAAQQAATEAATAPQTAQPQPPPQETLDSLAQRAEALARTEAELEAQVTPPTEIAAQAAQPNQPQPARDPTPRAQASQPAMPQAQQPDQQQDRQQPSQPATAQAPQQGQQQDRPGQPAQDRQQQNQAQADARQPVTAEAQRQSEAVDQAAELATDLRDNARATPLSRQRLDQARQRMEEALAELREPDRPAAATALDQAENQLQELATHLRGLDPVRAAETLERAARMAEQASRQLRAQAAQPSSTPPPAAAPPPSPEAATPTDAEQVARQAETTDDWLRRLATEPAKGLEATRNHLRQMRRELQTEALADQVRQAEQDRQQDRAEQARQIAQGTADRFQKLAEGLQQEHQRLVRSRLEQLAAAESKAKALQTELDRDAPPAQPKAQETARQLREFATQLQDLRDAPLDRAAREIKAQVPAPQGTAVPERLRRETIPGTVARLRTLIDEVVQREILVDRDARIPEQYSGLVESYFKALSDEQK